MKQLNIVGIKIQTGILLAVHQILSCSDQEDNSGEQNMDKVLKRESTLSCWFFKKSNLDFQNANAFPQQYYCILLYVHVCICYWQISNSGHIKVRLATI